MSDHATTPLTPGRLSDRVAGVLAARIASGVFEVGQRLPTEVQLQQEFGVSRTVIREAVHQLKAQGIITARQGSGMYVSSRSAEITQGYDPEVFSSVVSLVDLIEAWRPLAGEVAALAAERATSRHVADIVTKFKAIDGAVAAGRSGFEEQIEFNRAIVAATGNRYFEQFFSLFERHLSDGLTVTRGAPRRLAQYQAVVRKEQDAIVRAIEARDVESARRAAILHIRNGAKRLVEGVPADRLTRRSAPA